MLTSQLLFLLLALASEVLGTIGGFGSSVYFVPIASYFYDFQMVLGLTALYHLGSNLSKLALFKSGLNKRLLLYMGLPSVLLVVVGGLASALFPGSILEGVLGGFLIVLSLLFLLVPGLTVLPSRNNAIMGGAASGFSAGLLGTGGAIRGLTMAAFNLEKSTFIATSAAIDMMIDLSRSVVYICNGYVSKSTLYILPFLLVIAWVGTWLGKRILTRIPQERFKKLSLLLVLAIGIAIVLKNAAR